MCIISVELIEFGMVWGMEEIALESEVVVGHVGFIVQKRIIYTLPSINYDLNASNQNEKNLV